MPDQIVIVVELILYFAGMLAIGAYYARQELTQADYHMGGKRLSGWALALSERSTGESAWLILGLTGFAYSQGLQAVWIAAGCVTGITLSWIFLARKFREEADAYGAITYTDYFARKFPDHGAAIRVVSSLIIILFYVLYVAAQFDGGGKTLHATFGMPHAWGILLSAVIVTIYSAAGGFLSVVWTDAVQALLMIVTFLVTPVVMLFALQQQGLALLPAASAFAPAATGMMAELATGTAAVAGTAPGITSEAWGSWTGGLAGMAAGALLFNNFAWVFGYLGGQPQLAGRWMAMKDDRDVRTGMWVAILWTMAAYGGAIVIGLAAASLFGPRTVADPEAILPYTLAKLMPAWLSGILLTGAIAAMMSTASSMLLVATSAITEDVYHKALGHNLSDDKLVRISRITMFVVGMFGLILAFTSKSLIYTVISWAWAGIGCSFSPAVLLAFFWKRCSGAGILAAMVTGSLFTVIWMTTGFDAWITARAATFLVALAAGVIGSLAFPLPNAQR